MGKNIELSDFKDIKKPAKKPSQKTPVKSKPSATKAKDTEVRKPIKRPVAKTPVKPTARKPVKAKAKSDKTDKAKEKQLPVPSKKDVKHDITQGNKIVEQGQALIERMEDSVFDQNREQFEQYRAMFDNLVGIANTCLERYETSSSTREIYALMKVYDQLREVIADMKALQDVSDYLSNIDENVIRPFATAAADQLMELIRSLNTKANSILSPDQAAALMDHMKKQSKNTGLKLKEAYNASLSNARKILVG